MHTHRDRQVKVTDDLFQPCFVRGVAVGALKGWHFGEIAA